MNRTGSGAIAHRRRTHQTRKKTAVHGILDGTTSSKYRSTVLTKTFVVLMAGLFSFVSSEAGIPPPDGGNANGNTAEGTQALFSNTTGNANTAIGVGALYKNRTGVSNTAIGMAALGSNTTGFSNTAIGARALLNATGNHNVALGDSAGEFLSTGDNNIDIGYNVVGVKGESNTIRIGNTDIIATYVSGISGQTVVGGAAVFVDSNGKLGTMTASTRFSDEIKPMDKASEAILTLKPVTFRYNQEIDPKSIRQFGLIAEEVEKINPDLITRDREGKPYTVRYDAVNAMLLNEFLKEHRTVQEQQKEIDALKTELKEQRALIQKVNAKVELDKPAPQTVLNNQ
ncbi:MAG TPA: tail fiber domain-containing protein [Candidatus Udaeobacter sp.]|nr:tail fiber domain-containing protein [Candidatus Udaeobacter sp.]